MIDKCPGCGSPEIYNSGFKIECPTTGCSYYSAKQELSVRPTVPGKKTPYVDPYVDPVWPPSEPADRQRPSPEKKSLRPGAFISRLNLNRPSITAIPRENRKEFVEKAMSVQAVYDSGLVLLDGKRYNDARPRKTASSRGYRYTDTGWYDGLLIASVNEVTEAPEFHQTAGWWWCIRGYPDNSRNVDAGKVKSREEAIEKATSFSRVPCLEWRVTGENDE